MSLAAATAAAGDHASIKTTALRSEFLPRHSRHFSTSSRYTAASIMITTRRGCIYAAAGEKEKAGKNSPRVSLGISMSRESLAALTRQLLRCREKF